MTNESKSYPQIAFWLCIAGLLLLPVGFYVDFKNGVSEFNLFSRTGAVLTLLGVVLEFHLSIDASIRRKYTPGESISMLQLAKFFNQTTYEKKHRSFAHFMVIFGTFVWGFGDLIFKIV